ncbi:hypothetical protein DL96DRAFT_1457668 [Flagelloscypha sp. PMI_526]|nr:hypothetical protein DL96DRAFT_1457668 [Flagelloscypha sp. PMI_526]
MRAKTQTFSLCPTPCFGRKITFFYPIGNTPAVSLTYDLAAEDDARILLLGCGDPRNILYTIHSEKNVVTTRNLLIFTLIFDGGNSKQIWEIFFYPKSPAHFNKFLVSQCQKIHQLTASFELWESSTYSRIIRISTLDTLLLHQRFDQYSTFDQSTNSKIWSKFIAERNSRGSFRVHHCDGVFALQAFEALETHPVQFWSTATTSRAGPSSTLLNPISFFTQVTYGDSCRVHYSPYSLSGSHLPKAYTGSSDLSSVIEVDLI